MSPEPSCKTSDLDRELLEIMNNRFAPNKIKIADIQRLVGEGANVNAVDENGRSALHHAAATGEANVVQAVFDAAEASDQRPDLSLKDKNGLTPLLQASIDPNVSIIDMLLSHGADPNESDDFFKMTATHRVTQSQSPNALKATELLINAGAAVTAKNTFGETPVDIARNVLLQLGDPVARKKRSFPLSLPEAYKNIVEKLEFAEKASSVSKGYAAKHEDEFLRGGYLGF